MQLGRRGLQVTDREATAAQDRRRRDDACARYASQLGFQFGGAAGMRAALRDWPEPLLADQAAREVLRAVAEFPG